MRKVQSKSEPDQRSATVRKFHAYERSESPGYENWVRTKYSGFSVIDLLSLSLVFISFATYLVFAPSHESRVAKSVVSFFAILLKYMQCQWNEKKKRTSEHHAASTAWRKRSNFIWIILFNLPQTSAFPSGFQLKLGAVCRCLVPTSLHVKERKSNFTLSTELSDQNVIACSGIASDDIIASVMTSSLLCVAYQHRETGSYHNNHFVWVPRFQCGLREKAVKSHFASLTGLCQVGMWIVHHHESLWKWEGACFVPDDR